MNHTLPRTVLTDRQIAYVVTDRELRVIEHSQVGELFPGCADSCLGQPLPQLVPELIGAEEGLRQILSGELPRLHLPWVNRELPDGRTVYVDMVVVPRFDADGRVAGLIHLVQDVTWVGRLGQQLTQQYNELRLLQGQLAARNLELEAANAELNRLAEVRSAFVSIAAHELRTPLASIMGYLEMLLDGDAGSLNEKQRDYVALVENGARRLLRITNDLLDVTRLEVGSLQLHLHPTDLVAVVEQVIAEQSPRTAARSQCVVLSAAPDLPPALCDAMRAAQIIDNLLSNASKYSPPSGRISVGVARDAQDGFLRVTVSDKGIGIVEEDRPQLFDPFFRANSARVAGTSGAGLGLFIARSLVELHSGHIWYESHPGQGTTFYVTFPTADRSVNNSPHCP